MKNLLLTILIILSYSLSFAQATYTLISENKIWSEVDCLNFGGCQTQFYNSKVTQFWVHILIKRYTFHQTHSRKAGILMEQ